MNKFKVNTTPNNNRLAVMGIIEGTIFRIIKRVNGMVQIRLKGSDIVIKEELFNTIFVGRCIC